MEPVADKEQTVVQGNSALASTAAGQLKRSRATFVAACLGGALIVASDVSNVMKGAAVEWDQVGKSIGFVLVLVTLFLAQSALMRSERKAQLASSRLDRLLRCERCGHELKPQKCPECGEPVSVESTSDKP